MRILVTGHNGYIGTVLVPLLRQEGHEVVGLDSYFFEQCTFGAPLPDVPSIRKDIRDVQATDLKGFDAIIHLAALSNDPLGDLHPKLTYEINHVASVRLATLAKQEGIKRFLFSSSCSTYGAAGEELVDEEAQIVDVHSHRVRVEGVRGDEIFHAVEFVVQDFLVPGGVEDFSHGVDVGLARLGDRPQPL